MVQRRLAASVITSDAGTLEVRLVAGADVAAGRSGPVGRPGFARAAVVVLEYPSLAVAETAVVEGEVRFPYVPGLLSFREAPILLEALGRLERTPDLLMVDGQGLAHPRRFGLACHLGLLLELPTIGCAKSRLVGEHAPLPPERGSWVPLLDGGEVLGAVVRTQTGLKPVYVSVGYRVSLRQAVDWTLGLAPRYRIPEPVRRAHMAAGRVVALAKS